MGLGKQLLLGLIFIVCLSSLIFAQTLTFEVTHPGEEFTYDVRSDYNSYSVGVTSQASVDSDWYPSYERVVFNDDYDYYYDDDSDYYYDYDDDDDDDYPRSYSQNRYDYYCNSGYCSRRVYKQVYTKNSRTYYGNRFPPRYPSRNYYYPSSGRRDYYDYYDYDGYHNYYDSRYDTMNYYYYPYRRMNSRDTQVHYYPIGFTSNPRSDLDFFLNNPELFD
ncbi:MAG: hypothetical protein QS99_C0014G0009 [archaeon GW2011_AR4]|nr:MAG: hypothetical protein QS99_C0014G0009 [archaeon GW2011_AR4]